MINRNAKKPTLERPGKCPICGCALIWHTDIIGGHQIDSYRCLNGHEYNSTADKPKLNTGRKW